MEAPTKMLINGDWVPSKEGEEIEILNPYNGSLIAKVPKAGKEEVDQAVVAAQEAFKKYKYKIPAHKRAEILRRTSELIVENKEAFTEIIVKEAGKPWKYAAGEVSRAIQTFQFAAEEAKRIHGETIPMDAAIGSEMRRGFFIRQPLGVIGAITPFNFPLNLVAHKVAPAIAAGNTVVLKPASATPLTALKLGKVMMEAGLPKGVLNIVTGLGSEVGDLLVKNPCIRMITFTGSAAVGLSIKAGSGSKKITLELGSNSGVIVAKDCDLALAVSNCIVGGFAYSGQVCIHTQRIYVHESIKDEFTKEFLAGVRRLKIGDPVEKDCDIGPLIDEGAAIKAEDWVKEAVEQGAKILIGGKRKGNFLEPTVLENVTPDMKVVCEEVFAPVVVIDTFKEFDDAIAKFNEGSGSGQYNYGLSAGVFTHDLHKAFKAIEALEVGNVQINDSATFRVDHMPYGGIKDSGIGREGPRYAIEEMTEIKMVSFNLIGGGKNERVLSPQDRIDG